MGSLLLMRRETKLICNQNHQNNYMVTKTRHKEVSRLDFNGENKQFSNEVHLMITCLMVIT